VPVFSQGGGGERDEVHAPLEEETGTRQRGGSAFLARHPSPWLGTHHTPHTSPIPDLRARLRDTLCWHITSLPHRPCCCGWRFSQTFRSLAKKRFAAEGVTCLPSASFTEARSAGVHRRGMDSNERVLREAAQAYDSAGGEDRILRTEPDFVGHRELLAGLHAGFASELPQDLVERVCSIRAPNDCISVLLMGNHSAGKSSFVNWYVGEQVQTTSVAVSARLLDHPTRWHGLLCFLLRSHPHYL